MDAAPLGHVVAFEHLAVAVGGRFKRRHARDELHRQGLAGCGMHGQIEHGLGAAHIGGLELAVGGHLAQLGAVMQNASEALG